MAKLPPDKRNQVMMVAGGTVLVIGLIWFFVIRPQKVALTKKHVAVEEAQAKVSRAQSLLKRDDEIQDNLETVSRKVQAIEAQMATGDKYSWIRKTIREFQGPFQVNITTFNPPQEMEVDILPKFPYLAASFSLAGTAYYHDFGKFLASFENQFPYMRIQNLEIEPVGQRTAASPEEQEKLNFRMGIVTLVKPN